VVARAEAKAHEATAKVMELKEEAAEESK